MCLGVSRVHVHVSCLVYRTVTIEESIQVCVFLVLSFITTVHGIGWPGCGYISCSDAAKDELITGYGRKSLHRSGQPPTLSPEDSDAAASAEHAPYTRLCSAEAAEA